MIPRANIEAFAKAPPVNAFNIPSKPPPSDLEERSERAKESTPVSYNTSPSPRDLSTSRMPSSA